MNRNEQYGGEACCYLGRNKLFKIKPEEGISDLNVLEKDFKKAFKFHSNVRLQVTFERFDRNWDEYVELCILGPKEKLKASTLATPAETSEEVNNNSKTRHF